MSSQLTRTMIATTEDRLKEAKRELQAINRQRKKTIHEIVELDITKRNMEDLLAKELVREAKRESILEQARREIKQ